MNQCRDGELVCFTKHVSDLQAVDTQQQPVPCIWSLHKAVDEVPADVFLMLAACDGAASPALDSGSGRVPAADGFILCSSGRLISFVHRHTGREVFYGLTQMTVWLEASNWGKIAENKMIVFEGNIVTRPSMYLSFSSGKSKIVTMEKAPRNQAVPLPSCVWAFM